MGSIFLQVGKNPILEDIAIAGMKILAKLPELNLEVLEMAVCK